MNSSEAAAPVEPSPPQGQDASEDSTGRSESEPPMTIEVGAPIQAQAEAIGIEEKAEEALGATPEEEPSAAGILIQNTGVLHVFGLWMERTHPTVRPLLLFCIEMERIRHNSEEPQEGSMSASLEEDIEFIAMNYLTKGKGTRNLHKVLKDFEELGPLPDNRKDTVDLITLTEIQGRAKRLMEQKLLPSFLQDQGDNLEPADREALLSQLERINEELMDDTIVAQADVVYQRNVGKEARQRYLAGLGIRRDPSWAKGGAADPEQAASGEASAEQEAPAVEEEAAPAEEPEMVVEDVKPKPPLNDFTVIKVLGKGAFASVYKVKQISTEDIYAMKVMAIQDLKNKGALARVLEREKPVLEQITHPFIVGLVGGYISKNRVYLVMEYCPGGDLKKLLTLQAQRGCFPEQQARFYTAELILALECLHSRGVIYRDLKPENVLLDRHGHVRLADFGLVKQGVQGSLDGATSFLGTPLYLSPEMVQKSGHGQATDWWGLGIMLFEMLTGDAPFQGADGTIDGLFREIQEGDLPLAQGVSPEAMSLMQGLLAKDAATRFTGMHCKEHPWFAKHNPPLNTAEDWDRLFNKEFVPPYIPDDENAVKKDEGKSGKKNNQGMCAVM